MERLGVQSGQTVAGKYRLEELLGHGGMGSVWRAQHLELLSPVALKVLKPAVAENDNSMARFLREAKAAARLRSPHVVQILDHGQDGAVAYIAMELLEGESLLARLQRDKRLSPELTATIITHVGRAIGRAHEAGIVHRDLKPDNVFLIPNEEELIAKVLDFGIAKSTILELNATGSPQTKTGALLGTPYYMSPEQAAGEKSVDHRTDLWALGVIAFECLCGRRPFQSDALGELVLQICVKPVPVPSATNRVPIGFDPWFAKATAREPNDRFQNARQMTAELREALLGEEAPTRRAAPDEPAGAGTAEPGFSSAEATTPRAEQPRHTPSHAAAGGGSVSEGVQLGSARTQLSEEEDPPARSAPLPSQLSAEPVAGETLDPMSATAVPRKRRMVLGAVVALLGVAVLVVGIAWMVPAGSEDSGQVPQTSAAGAPSPEAVSPTAAPDDPTPLDDPAGADEVSSPNTSDDAGPKLDTSNRPASPAPGSVRPREAIRKPVASPPRPPAAPPEDDPLGI